MCQLWSFFHSIISPCHVALPYAASRCLMDNTSDKGKTSSVDAQENFRGCWLLPSCVLPGCSEIPALLGLWEEIRPWCCEFSGHAPAAHLSTHLTFSIYTPIEVTGAVCMLKSKYMLKLAQDQRFQCFVGPVLAGAQIICSCNLAQAFNEFRIGPKKFIFPALEGLQGNKFKVLLSFYYFLNIKFHVPL